MINPPFIKGLQLYMRYNINIPELNNADLHCKPLTRHTLFRFNNEAPLVITNSGIEVPSFRFNNQGYPVFTERVTTGIERLDNMLEGGYLRGTSILITGSSGTAKSTLGGAFAQAACLRGEPTLYISFDENASEIVRNLSSVGINLTPHLQSGLLSTYSNRSKDRSAEEHLVQIKALIRKHHPHNMVIDPISSLIKAGGQLNALAVSQRLIHLTKSEGITLIMTSLLAGDNPDMEATPLLISTIADTWMHLSYMMQGGERNRALTIIKSRGTHHSNQVHELILSDEGISLCDVYTSGGTVLMGTLRYEKEEAEREEQERLSIENKRRKHELLLTEAETNVRIESLKRELENMRAELTLLDQQQAQRLQEQQER